MDTVNISVLAGHVNVVSAIHDRLYVCINAVSRTIGVSESRLRNVEKETRILKHIEKDEYILRNQLCNILYTYYPCIDHIHIWLKKG